MARPLRIKYPNALYHIMNRGLDRQDIFSHSDHFKLFLEILMDANIRYQLVVHAYCLMNNHYHLLAATPNPNLSEIMRHVNGVYTQKLNRLIGRDGPIFRGRFKAKLVDADSYLIVLSRYIHLNPVSAGIVKHPEEYLWSSYRHYINNIDRPPWLCCEPTLAYFEQKTSNYEKFVRDGMGIVPNFVNNMKFPIIGTEEFIKKTNEEHVRGQNYDEIPEQRLLLQKVSRSANEILDTVSHYFNIDVPTLASTKYRRGGSLARDIAIYLLLQIPGQKINSLKDLFNHSGPNISQIYNRTKEKAKKDKVFIEHIEKIKLMFR